MEIREALSVKRGKTITDFKMWQKSPVPERENDSELDKMSLTLHYVPHKAGLNLTLRLFTESLPKWDGGNK